MQLTGIIKVIKEEVVVSDKFRKRELVLTDNSNSEYPQHISFQLTQDRCSLLDPYKVGDVATIHFNIRGREWTSPQGEIKFFNTLEAWKLDRGVAAPAAVAATENLSNDDLPF
jgi:hypothetical protein